MPRINVGKLIATSLVLIAFAPISSIFYIFSNVDNTSSSSLHFHTGTISAIAGVNLNFRDDTKADLHKVQKENFGNHLEDFMQTILNGKIDPNTLTSLQKKMDDNSDLFPNMNSLRVYHLTRLFPWCFSLSLYILLNAKTFISNFFEERRRIRYDNWTYFPLDLERSLGDNKMKKAACIMNSFTSFTKTLKKSDILDSEENARQDSTSSICINVPSPGSWLDEKVKIRFASGTCAICLMQYEANDTVVWSSNGKCLDVFHRDCIMMWMSGRNKGYLDCPCCRQPFIDANIFEEEAKRITKRKKRD